MDAMKTLLVMFLLSLPGRSFSQYVIITADKKVSAAADISAASSQHDLVLLRCDVDSIVAVLGRYREIMHRNIPARFSLNRDTVGHSIIVVKTRKASAVHRYEVTIETPVNGTTYRRRLTDLSQTNGANARVLDWFTGELRRVME